LFFCRCKKKLFRTPSGVSAAAEARQTARHTSTRGIAHSADKPLWPVIRYVAPGPAMAGPRDRAGADVDPPASRHR
jgi:hypothetical protein